MSFSDIMLGKRPEYRLLPGMQDSINDIQGLDFNSPSFLHRRSKGTLKRLDRGDDVSDIGEFASIRQNQAADLSDIDMDYATGANVLNAMGGGEQANQINAMRDRAKERRREQTGMQYVGALSDLRNSATGTLQSENAMRDNNLLRQQQLLLQARSNVGRNERSGGILPSLIQGGAQVASAFICWVAQEIYGDDLTVSLIRNYLLKREAESVLWAIFVSLYRWKGERFAKFIQTHRKTRLITKFIFDRILEKATEQASSQAI